jgi:hypothetical protein
VEGELWENMCGLSGDTSVTVLSSWGEHVCFPKNLASFQKAVALDKKGSHSAVAMKPSTVFVKP